MLKTTRSRGQTMPFILATTIVLALVGIAMASLTQIFGGSQESKNATDAGILNLSKFAIKEPAVDFDPQSGFQKMYKDCTSASAIDLAEYNRMVSAATIIALNASADGRDSALANAEGIINELQGTSTSVGAKLKNIFADPEKGGNWAKKQFEAVALTNSLRMAGSDSSMSWDPSQYQVAYLENASGDLGASNIPLSKLLDNMPHVYDEKGLSATRLEVPKDMVSTDGFDKYLHGYKPIFIDGINKPIYAVPTQPKHQPHLVSLQTFSAEEHQRQPGLDKNVFLPPNAFRGGAQVKDTKSGSAHSSTAAGIVGMPIDPSAFEARLPMGYLILDNSLKSDYSASIPSSDTWEACEAGTGTLVHRESGVFSSSGVYNKVAYNALDSWLHTPRPEGFDPESGPSIKDDEGRALLYDKEGTVIDTKAKAAQLIPFDDKPSSVVLATDRNSDPDGHNPDPDCVLHASPSLPDNMSPFNRAYHPNSNGSGGTHSGRNLIAAEQAKLHVLDQYGPSWTKGARAFNRNFGRTGLRLYPNKKLPTIGGPYTYAPAGATLTFGDISRVPYGDASEMGKVTTDGSLAELFEQTTGEPEKAPYVRIDNYADEAIKITKKQELTPTEEVKKFILQRLREIKPSASESDLAKVVDQKLSLGARYYVYLERPQDPSSQFLVSQNPPSWARSFSADGLRHAFVNTYQVSDNMINAANDFGIHDHLFMTNSVRATATDVVSYESSSGANGVLGIIKFCQMVKASSNFTVE